MISETLKLVAIIIHTVARIISATIISYRLRDPAYPKRLGYLGMASNTLFGLLYLYAYFTDQFNDILVYSVILFDVVLGPLNAFLIKMPKKN